MDLKKEKQLLEQAQENKEEFAHIYNYFIKDVYRFAYSLTKNHQDAEDITSQTFKQFLEKINEFTWQEKSLKSWLFITTKNIAYASNRKLTRQTYIEDMDAVVDEQEISFVDVIISKDLSQKIKEEVLLLHPYEQQVITLRIWDGLDFKAISEIQNISEDAAKKRFYRAINKLQIKLNKEKNFYGIVPFPILFTGLKVAGESFISFPSSLSFSSFLLSTTQAKASMIQLLTSKALLGGTIAATVVATGTGVYFVTKDDKKAEEEKVAEVKSTATPSPTQIITVSPTGTPVATPIPPLTKVYTDNDIKLEFVHSSKYTVEAGKFTPHIENVQLAEKKITVKSNTGATLTIDFITGGIGCFPDNTIRKVDSLFKVEGFTPYVVRYVTNSRIVYSSYSSSVNGEGYDTGCRGTIAYTDTPSYPEFGTTSGNLTVTVSSNATSEDLTNFDNIVKSFKRLPPANVQVKEYIDNDIRLSFKHDSSLKVEAGKFTPYKEPSAAYPEGQMAEKTITITDKNNSKLVLAFSNGGSGCSRERTNVTVDALVYNSSSDQYIARLINGEKKIVYETYSSNINGQGYPMCDILFSINKPEAYPEFGGYSGSVILQIEATDKGLNFSQFDEIVKSIKRF